MSKKTTRPRKAKKTAKPKKALKKKKAKKIKMAAALTAPSPVSILCNTITESKHFYKYLTGVDGAPNVACGNAKGQVRKKHVNPPVQEGTCDDGKPFFRITFK